MLTVKTISCIIGILAGIMCIVYQIIEMVRFLKGKIDVTLTIKQFICLLICILGFTIWKFM